MGRFLCCLKTPLMDSKLGASPLPINARLFAKGLIRYPADGYVYDAGHFYVYVFRQKVSPPRFMCVFRRPVILKLPQGIPHR